MKIIFWVSILHSIQPCVYSSYTYCVPRAVCRGCEDKSLTHLELRSPTAEEVTLRQQGQWGTGARTLSESGACFLAGKARETLFAS